MSLKSTEFIITIVIYNCNLPVAKVEMAEISILLNGFVERLIQDLNERSHVGEVFIHLTTGRKIAEKNKKKSFIF